MRSGYSSRILEISRVPIPEPVPPPNEWVNWKPYRYGKVRSLERLSHAVHLAFPSYLEAIAALGLLTNYVEDGVDQLSTFGVVTFGPVVAGSGLSKDEVVRAEELAEWSRADRVHCAWLQIDQDGTWDVLATTGLIVVDVDAFQLQLRLAVVSSIGLDAVLVGDNLPELKGK